MPENLFEVKGKTIVITGGLGQLGRQFSLSLLRSGANIVILDKKTDSKILNSYFKDYLGRKLIFLNADVTKSTSLKKALKAITDKFPLPYGLINNAGIDSPPSALTELNGPFETYPEAAWDKVLEVNLKGVFLCSQVFGAAMAKAKRGSIINISSIYGLVSPDQRVYAYRNKRKKEFFKPVSYSVSKSGILNLTRYLATYWANSGVRVNTLTLGGVFNNQDKEFISAYKNRVPLERLAKEDEYNGAIIFLLSDASSYMTGSNLVIDGGWIAW